MHNLKEIRKDFPSFEKALEKRSIKIDFKKLQDLDEENRNLIQKKESIEKEKKDISKSKDETLFKKSKEPLIFGEIALMIQILEYGGIHNSLLTFKH